MRHLPGAYLLALWAMFLAGVLANLISRCDASISSKLSGVKTSKEFFWAHHRQILARAFLLSLIFGAWVASPRMFTSLLQKVGLSFDGDAIPLNRATAGIFGFLGDLILDRLAFLFPALRREIPPIDDPGPSAPPTPEGAQNG